MSLVHSPVSFLPYFVIIMSPRITSLKNVSFSLIVFNSQIFLITDVFIQNELFLYVAKHTLKICFFFVLFCFCFSVWFQCSYSIFSTSPSLFPSFLLANFLLYLVFLVNLPESLAKLCVWLFSYLEEGNGEMKVREKR